MCDTCNREREIFHVTAPPPHSDVPIRLCRECALSYAMPEHVFEAMYTACEGNTAFFANTQIPWLSTYKDGDYVSWDAWVDWRRAQVTQ